jgi:hypothetical protein
MTGTGRAARWCPAAARVLAGSALALIGVWAVACGSKSGGSPVAPTPPPSTTLPTVAIMGSARLTGAQLVAWFLGRTPQPSGAYAATVSVASLADLFVDEGRQEGVTGDVAFMQSIVETGWFRFSGSVPASFNNFAGIGATDTNPQPAQFPDARTGVRAQIQHLRAYGDPTAATCTVPPLANPCVDPRFHLVTPKGRALMWNQMGNGNWATATTYATTILTLYVEALRFHGLQP